MLAEHRHNLPAHPVRLIGRDEEVIAVRQRLLEAERGLLTLTGAGGCGKTSLALAVARGLVDEFPDGVWLVELAPLADPALVGPALATVLEVREGPGRPLVDALIGYLGPRRLLLVLDNCEHLVDACAALVDRLLAACPEIHILATSREPLRVSVERLSPVPVLAVPDPRRLPPLAELAGVPAVRLFVERAQAAQPRFGLTDRNAVPVAQVCARLEGMPLAIELAAARIAALAVETLAARLDDTFRLLAGSSRTAPGRQQTLEAALDWSYDLLSDDERAVLRRLAVFAGGFDLEAAEAVGAGDGIESADVLDLLARLVEKSLVIAEGADDNRYRLLEPIRQYARQRLATSEDTEPTARRHARFFLAVAREADALLRGPRQLVGYDRLNREADNLRAALGWAAAGGAEAEEIGQALAAALGWYWLYDSHTIEGEHWLGTFAERGGADPAARARHLVCRAAMEMLRPDSSRGAVWAERSRALCRQVGDRPGEALAAIILAYNLGFTGDAVHGLLAAAEALDLAQGDPWLGGWARDAQGHLFSLVGDDSAAERSFRDALTLFRTAGAAREAAAAAANFAAFLLFHGAHREAAALARESLATLRAQGTRFGVRECLDTLAGVAAVEGRAERAARLFGAAEAEIAATGVARIPNEQRVVERGLAAARPTMEDAAFRAAFAEGRAMSTAVAIEYALQVPGSAAAAGAESETAGGPPATGRGRRLTAREADVLRLVVAGKSNREIAAALVLSPKTVARHLDNLYGKLDVSSRVEATAVALREGLA